jgi:ornithine cyclodeaminase/alanine dehydrogenase-like protein (mu-crystallin family)
VAKSRFYVDYKPAAMAAAGELLNAIASGAVGESHIVGEIGQVVMDSVPSRENSEQITMYKSLGVASQDLAAAHAVWAMAEEEGSGLEVELMA